MLLHLSPLFGNHARHPSVNRKVTHQHALSETERLAIHELGHAFWMLLVGKDVTAIELLNNNEGYTEIKLTERGKNTNPFKEDAIELLYSLGGIQFESEMALSTRLKRSPHGNDSLLYWEIRESGRDDMEKVASILFKYRRLKSEDSQEAFILTVLKAMKPFFHPVNREKFILASQTLPQLTLGKQAIKNYLNSFSNPREFERYKKTKLPALIALVAKNLEEAR